MSDNPLAWRESSAVADMHVRLAAKKFNSLITKDSPDIDRMLSELGKAVECIEAAHEAAMRAYNELAHQARRAKSVKGVRLTSLKERREPAPLKVAIGQQTKHGPDCICVGCIQDRNS